MGQFHKRLVFYKLALPIKKPLSFERQFENLYFSFR
jgi:hypothetical protein